MEYLETAGFGLQDLLQELLMALVGCTGDVFVDLAPQRSLNEEIMHPERCTVQLAQDIAWAGIEDRDQLNKLVQLGFHYQQLQKFIQQEQQAGSPTSLYRLALCEGLTEVLAAYEDEVSALQEVLLEQGADRGLPGLTYQLADLQTLLPQLHQLAYDLRRRPPRISSNAGSSAADETTIAEAAAAGGCWEVLVAPPEARGPKLLAALHTQRLNGQPLLQACVQRLLWHVNQVLFNQLTMWMVHGLLTDGGGEFFIRPREPGQQSGAGSGQQLQQAAGDVAVLAADNGQAGSQHLLTRTEEETYRDWHEAFEVALHELPPGITPHLASCVEFIGRAVRLLRAPPASAKLRQLQDSCGQQSYSSMACQQQLGWAAAGEAAQLHHLQQLLPHEDTLAFASVLRVLQQQPVFSQAALERTVEAIRADVASRLWQLLVVQAGLMQHLAAVKDYALLARGDFYQCFLADAAKLLAAPPREKTVNSDLSVPWQSAAMKSTAQDDPHFRLFQLVLRPKAGTEQAKQQQPAGAGGEPAAPAPSRALNVPAYDSAWDDLQLEAQLPWPLGVLLTPRHMQRYNALFQLLLRLKRVQLALESAWQELGRLCGRSGGGTSASDIAPLLQLRQHMGHLISNLQIYLQLDVVESNYARLQDKVAAAQDFSEAEHAHERFLHALVTQSFLGHSAIVKQIGEVFGQTRALCSLVRGARERGIDCDLVREVHSAFDKTMSSLYVNLQSKTLQQYDKAPYLRQLYLRLDFNGFIRHRQMRMLAVFKSVPTDYRQQQLLQQQLLQQQQQQRVAGQPRAVQG